MSENEEDVKETLEDLNKRIDEVSDEDFLKMINLLLNIKELEVPICLMMSRISKSLLTKEESANVDSEMVSIVRMFQKQISKMEKKRRFSPISAIDALAYMMLALHVYIMENSKEYKEYSDKLREMVVSGSYIGKEDFFDPSIR